METSEEPAHSAVNIGVNIECFCTGDSKQSENEILCSKHHAKFKVLLSHPNTALHEVNPCSGWSSAFGEVRVTSSLGQGELGVVAVTGTSRLTGGLAAERLRLGSLPCCVMGTGMGRA